MESVLPDYKTLTGYDAPASDDLRPRGHGSSFWTDEGNLVHELILQPILFEEGGDPVRHKITLKLGPEEFSVVKREKLDGQE